MDKNQAKEIILKSAKNFIDINGTMTKANLEAEIINNICYFLLDFIPKNPAKNSPEFIDEITNIFIDAAIELFPQHFTEPAIFNTRIAVHQNLSWDGMPNFLINYFHKNHNKKISFQDEPETLSSQVRKMAELLTAILNKQGSEYKTNVILGILRDFKSSSRNQMERDIEDNDLRDVEVLRKTIKMYSNITDKIEDQSFHDAEDFKLILKDASNLYYYYEGKYVDELKHRNSQQRQKYIEEILSPLMMIIIYIKELIENN